MASGYKAALQPSMKVIPQYDWGQQLHKINDDATVISLEYAVTTKGKTCNSIITVYLLYNKNL
jgi:hypothetical protein